MKRKNILGVALATTTVWTGLVAVQPQAHAETVTFTGDGAHASGSIAFSTGRASKVDAEAILASAGLRGRPAISNADIKIVNSSGVTVAESRTLVQLGGGNVVEALSAILRAGSYTFKYMVRVANGGAFAGNLTVTPVPIPAALPLFAAAVGGLGFLGWRKRRSAPASAVPAAAA